MILLSFNLPRLGGGPKCSAFKWLLESSGPSIVFLQETMMSGLVACDFFLKLCPNWYVSAIDACGDSGGTLVGWNPTVADLRAYNTGAGFLLFGNLKGFEVPVHLLNVYGPYSHRVNFWNDILTTGIISLPNLILVGDLNFTWSAAEVWGS